MIKKYSFIGVVTIIAALIREVEACASNAQGVQGSCLCLQGYYGTNAETNGTCNKCPSGTTTNIPSSSPGGNTALQADESVCFQCMPNYYMKQAAEPSSGTAASCTACPNNSGNTGPGSVGDVSTCNLCQMNYFMTSAAVLQAGSTAAQSAKCRLCPNGSGTASKSSAVSDISGCNVCQANYFMLTAASVASTGQTADAALCMACPQFSYSSVQTAVGSLSSCTCYDALADSLSIASACQCQNGYTGTVATQAGAASGCSQCPPNQISNGGSACVTCGSGSYASSDQSYCTCYDISTGVLPWYWFSNQCVCAGNYYGNPAALTSAGSNSCVLCPNSAVSKMGTLLKSGCQGASNLNFSIIILILTFFSFVYLL